MYKKFEINPTKIKGSCQSGGKVVTHNSKSDLPLIQIEKSLIVLLNNSLKQALFNIHHFYRPQQMALTTGFMCIVACDCNQRPTLSLDNFSIDDISAQFARDTLCEFLPWGEVDFSLIHSDTVAAATVALAKLSSPIADNLCDCIVKN